MKKLISILTLVAMIIALGSCIPTGILGQDGDEQGKTSNNSIGKPDGESPVPLENVKELIQKCLTLKDHFSGGGISVLAELNLASYEKLSETYNASISKNLKLPDGRQYRNTGISYVNYEKALAQYMTKELFENMFMEAFAIVDDMIVDVGGESSGNNPEVIDATYMGKIGAYEQYKIRIYNGWTDNWNISESYSSINLTKNENGYVLANIKEEKSIVKESKDSTDSPIKLEDVSKRVEYILNLGEEASVNLKGALVILGLTTREKLMEAYNSSKGKKRPDSELELLYWDTGISLLDYEKAMMKYVTKDLFERKFIRKYEIIDDMLIIGSGNAVNEYSFTVLKCAYLGKSDLGEEYLLNIYIDDKKGIEFEYQSFIRFKQNSNDYVISEVLMVIE